MELYRLDEEEVKNLVTKEGLKVFLETTFGHPFSTLQDFLDFIELPFSSLPLKSLPYLLRFDFVPANNNLKKDLQKINNSSYFPWAIPNHPAYEYLFGKPQPTRHEILFHLEKAVRSLPRRDFNRFPRTAVNQQSQKTPWWQRLWYFLLKLWQKITKTSTHHIVEQLSASMNAPLTATLATPFPFRLPLNREELIAARVRVAEQLELARRRHHQQSQNQTNNLQEQRNELQERLTQIEQKLSSYPTEDFYTRFPQEYHQQQKLLFERS